MDGITDLSELCRLCLETSLILISFETRVYYTAKSIPELITFCLGVECDDADGMLPNHVCQMCLEKLQQSFEFQSKSRESDKYLREIVSQTMGQQDEDPNSNYEHDDQKHFPIVDEHDSLLEPINRPSSSKSLNGSNGNSRTREKTGKFDCKICVKTFKYLKPFLHHMSTHKRARGRPSKRSVSPEEDAYSSAQNSRKVDDVRSTASKRPRRMVLEQISHKNSEGYQHESIIPYSPQPINPYYDHDETINCLVKDDDSLKRINLPSTSSSDGNIISLKKGEKYGEFNCQICEKPFKYAKPYANHMSLHEPVVDQESGKRGCRRRPPTSDHTKDFAEFNHAISIPSDDDGSSESKTSISTILSNKKKRSRSRSPSVEIIPEVDIFNFNTLADDDDDVHAIATSPTPGRSDGYYCDIKGCSEKFHLRANLKKHKRNKHNI